MLLRQHSVHIFFLVRKQKKKEKEFFILFILFKGSDHYINIAFLPFGKRTLKLRNSPDKAEHDPSPSQPKRLRKNNPHSKPLSLMTFNIGNEPGKRKRPLL